jgi:periplasmic divalent cation tolerance protein
VTDTILVLTMLPDADAAVGLARTLVAEKLAACCNILPAIRSIYRWKGNVEDANEVLVLIKTRNEHFDRVQARILELHPYEVPEVLSLPVEQGYYPYLEWLARETS